MTMLFAATYPERTSALVLVNASARVARGDDYPIGVPRKLLDQFVENLVRGWGTGDILELSGPSMAKDPALKATFGRYQRLAMPPGTVAATYGGILESDIRSVLPAIRVPTLVIHREGNLMLRPDHGRYLAENIDGARCVELLGSDFFPFFAGDFDSVPDEVQEFLTGSRAEPEADRVLATVLFTNRGRGPRARSRGALRPPHRRGGDPGEDVGGIAVNLAARVMAEAGPGEVLVSSTVKDLVVGSGIEFDDRGTHELKGVPGEWRCTR